MLCLAAGGWQFTFLFEGCFGLLCFALKANKCRNFHFWLQDKGSDLQSWQTKKKDLVFLLTAFQGQILDPPNPLCKQLWPAGRVPSNIGSQLLFKYLKENYVICVGSANAV